MIKHRGVRYVSRLGRNASLNGSLGVEGVDQNLVRCKGNCFGKKCGLSIAGWPRRSWTPQLKSKYFIAHPLVRDALQAWETKALTDTNPIAFVTITRPFSK